MADIDTAIKPLVEETWPAGTRPNAQPYNVILPERPKGDPKAWRRLLERAFSEFFVAGHYRLTLLRKQLTADEREWWEGKFREPERVTACWQGVDNHRRFWRDFLTQRVHASVDETLQAQAAFEAWDGGDAGTHWDVFHNTLQRLWDAGRYRDNQGCKLEEKWLRLLPRRKYGQQIFEEIAKRRVLTRRDLSLDEMKDVAVQWTSTADYVASIAGASKLKLGVAGTSLTMGMPGALPWSVTGVPHMPPHESAGAVTWDTGAAAGAAMRAMDSVSMVGGAGSTAAGGYACFHVRLPAGGTERMNHVDANVYVLGGSRMTRAVADTGAEISVISRALVDEWGLTPVRLDKPHQLRMGNEASAVVTHAVQLPFQLNGETDRGTWTFDVLDFAPGVILGNDWITHREGIVQAGKKLWLRQDDGSMVEVPLVSKSGRSGDNAPPDHSIDEADLLAIAQVARRRPRAKDAKADICPRHLLGECTMKGCKLEHPPVV